MKHLHLQVLIKWALLFGACFFFSGYLTFNQRALTDSGEYSCSLILPNQEIRALYKKLINQIFTQAIGNFAHLQDLFNALITGNINIIEDLLQKFIITSISSFDIPDTESEKSYHMFVLGLLVALEDTYAVRSNRESGYGRYDVMLIPHDKSKTGVVIEFKSARRQTLEQATEDALLQIQDKKYASELHAQGVKNIMGYGIAFSGKEVLVKSIVL